VREKSLVEAFGSALRSLLLRIMLLPTDIADMLRGDVIQGFHDFLSAIAHLLFTESVE